MNSYLGLIKSPEDVKTLSAEQTEGLCSELRKQIISTVSENGGHLASNLGAVELTVALLKVFSPPSDKIVWDVGHQAYAYKLLTGRASQFHTLRRKDGISGFPNREESEFDPYTSGHASTSVSVALGFAAAEDIRHSDNHVVAVIGDGALTGGLAYEGLNNAGRLKRNFIVILNDNKMSISKNVGSMSKYLAHLRTTHRYIQTKGKIEKAVDKMPVLGKGIHSFVSKSKTLLKHFLYGANLFENLGFKYYGPFDGHDIEGLTEILNNIKEINEPVLLHVITSKGKGYQPAEENPGQFHGVGSFVIENGEIPASSSPNFSSVFGDELCKMAEEDQSVCAITAAMTYGTGLQNFAKRYPDRFFDVGIAEEHAVTFASGMAAGGMKPVFAVYSTFLQRSYDQIIHDASLQKVNVTLAVDRAGIVGDDGETHQGIFDAAFLSGVPGIRVYSPSFYEDLALNLNMAVNENGLSVVRYPRGGEGYKPQGYKAEQRDFVCYPSDKAEIYLVAYGRLFSHACMAAEELSREGYSVSVLKLNVIAPLNVEIYPVLKEASHIFSFEEGVLSGGVGERLAAFLLEKGYKGKFHLRGVEDCFIKHGKPEELLQELGLTKAEMMKNIKSELASEE